MMAGHSTDGIIGDDAASHLHYVRIMLALSSVLAVIRAERKKLAAESTGVLPITHLADSKAALARIFKAVDEYDVINNDGKK